MFIDYNDFNNKLSAIKFKKTPKTFLQIIDKTYSEVLVSKYLAYFLDEHNINNKILKQILIKTQQESDPDFIELLDTATFESIKTEDAISNQSRLDIIIKYSNFWVVIENKIWAWESRLNQTSDYEKHINAHNIDKLPIKFIYLKPNFNKSKPSNKHFTELYYSDLVNILKTITLEDLHEKQDYLYLQDFIKHSEEFFMKDDQLNCDEQALQFYFENKNKIDYIIETYKSQALNIRKLVVNSIAEAFPKFKVHDTTSYIQIFKDNWENRGSTGIHFEIIASNTNFDSLLGNKVVKLRYAVHNERNTKEKYTNIIHQSLYTKEYMFNNNENIQKSIQEIILEIKLLIDRFEKIIDDEISNKSNK